MVQFVRWFGFCLLVAIPFLAAGCTESGPPLGTVTGVVTLDGKPLEGAQVEFQPIVPADGSPSYSINRTGPDGSYELQFNDVRKGAMVGEHQVRVSTYQQKSTEEGGGFIPEQVPPKFNRESELKKTVEKGENVIDLPLTSK